MSELVRNSLDERCDDRHCIPSLIRPGWGGRRAYRRDRRHHRCECRTTAKKAFLITRQRQPVLASGKASGGYSAQRMRGGGSWSRDRSAIKWILNSARFEDVLFTGSVGPHEGGFDIAQRGIDPFESRGASRLFAASGLHRAVQTSGLGDSGEACQTVGDDIGAGVEGGACELSDRKAAEGFDGPKDDLIWLAIVRCWMQRRTASSCCASPAAAGPEPPI